MIGWRGGVLQVRLRATPVEGRANAALLRLLAQRLGLPPSALSIVSGARGRLKRLQVEGLARDELNARLAGEEADRLEGPPQADGRPG